MADCGRARRAVGWMARLLAIGGLGGAHALLGAAPAGASPCDIATITWDGGAGTTAWATAANWSGDRLPGADDHVCIPAGAGSVSHSGTTSIKSIEANRPFTLAGSLSLTAVTVDSSMTGGTIGGTLNGPGILQLFGTVSWSGGEMKSLGVTRVTPGAQLNITTQNCCSNRPIGSNYTLIVDGTLSIAGGEGLNVGENFMIRNNGRIEWTPTSYSDISDASAATAVKPLIINAGTIVKTAGDNKAIGVPLWNQAAGVVKSDIGTLTFSGGGGGNTSCGTFGPGLVLSGTNTLSGATFTGAGNEVYGTQTLAAGSTTTIASGSTTKLAATLNGPGKLVVAGAATWTSGAMQGGGTTEVATDGRINVTSMACCSNISGGSNYTLVNDGTLAIDGGEGITLGSNFQIVNNGRLEWAPGSNSDISLANGATNSLITNTGTIVKTAGVNKAIGLPVWNKGSGVVKSDVGTLSLTAGSGGNTSSGTFGPGLVLSGTNTLSGATFTGAGNTISGTVTMAGATASMTTPGSTTTLSATVTGGGKLVVRGTLDWSGGTLQGGTTYVAEGARLNLVNTSCCSNRSLGSNYTIVNDGTTSIGSGEGFNFGDAFEVYNNGRLEWSPTTYSDLSGASALIANAGTFVKQGTYNGPVYVPVENDGTIEVEAGSLQLGERFRSFSRTRNVLKEGEYVLKGALRVSNLNVVRNAARITLDGTAATLTDLGGTNALRNLAFNAGGGRLTLRNGATLTTLGLVRNAGKVTVEAGSALTTVGYTQSRGATIVEAPTSTLSVGASPGMTLAAGSLRGSGVVQGNVTNNGGSVTPGGAAPGQLAIQGDFTQAAGGSLALDVAGTTTHDSLSVSGTASLGGHLALLTAPAYVPVAGDSFNLLTYATHTGAFATASGTALPGGLTYLLQLEPQSMTAVVQ